MRDVMVDRWLLQVQLTMFSFQGVPDVQIDTVIPVFNEFGFRAGF